VEKIERIVIRHRIGYSVTAGNEQYVEARRTAEIAVGPDGRREIGNDERRRLRDRNRTNIGSARQEVERSGKIEQFESGENEHADRRQGILLFALKESSVEIEFAVELTVPDNTAFTVATALRELGYRNLDRVERSDLYRLRLRDDAMSLSDCANALTRAEVVFNPNKHRLAYASDAICEASEAVVADKDCENENLAQMLTSHFGIQGLERLEQATAWRLYEIDGSAPAQRLDWACKTLLANPHSQTYCVRQRPVYQRV
jgi:phosphoribosylformylglycinamidine (FGAM) synthase PurS component